MLAIDPRATRVMRCASWGSTMLTASARRTATIRRCAGSHLRATSTYAGLRGGVRLKPAGVVSAVDSGTRIRLSAWPPVSVVFPVGGMRDRLDAGGVGIHDEEVRRPTFGLVRRREHDLAAVRRPASLEHVLRGGEVRELAEAGSVGLDGVEVSAGSA